MGQDTRLAAWNAYRPARHGAYKGIVCATNGCQRPAKCRGLCSSHYAKTKWASGSRPLSCTAPKRLETRRKWRYGIDGKDFNRMFAEQNGLCAICLTDGSAGRPKHWVTNLIPDHNHQTGKLRGLLCNDCNRIAGRTRDTKILERAIDYVRTRY